MSKPKKTILKTIELFFKSHTEDKPKDPEIKDNTKRSILKVIDKEENIADRTTDTTFPTPSEPIMNESNFQVRQDDYTITDLTKREDIANNEVQPPREEDININQILKDLDGKLDENHINHTLNILTTRSSKDTFRESALVEYTLHDKSYVVSLIVEKEENKYKYSLRSSYGKEIYSKIVDGNKLNEAVYHPFNAIALRDKFQPILKEALDADRMGEIMADVQENISDEVQISYPANENDPLVVTFASNNTNALTDARNYILNKFTDTEVSLIDNNSFTIK